jgi:hypothetical protein
VKSEMTVETVIVVSQCVACEEIMRLDDVINDRILLVRRFPERWHRRGQDVRHLHCDTCYESAGAHIDTLCTPILCSRFQNLSVLFGYSCWKWRFDVRLHQCVTQALPHKLHSLTVFGTPKKGRCSPCRYLGRMERMWDGKPPTARMLEMYPRWLVLDWDQPELQGKRPQHKTV